MKKSEGDVGESSEDFLAALPHRGFKAAGVYGKLQCTESLANG